MSEAIIITAIMCFTVVLVEIIACGTIIKLEKERKKKPPLMEQLFGSSKEQQ